MVLVDNYTQLGQDLLVLKQDINKYLDNGSTLNQEQIDYVASFNSAINKLSSTINTVLQLQKIATLVGGQDEGDGDQIGFF